MIRLDVRGPSVDLLVRYLQEKFEWEIAGFEQTSFFSGWIEGRHPFPNDFVGIGISDGTYIKSVQERDDG